MGVDHVLATNSAATWAIIRGDEKKEDVMRKGYNERRGQWRGMLRLGKLGLVAAWRSMDKWPMCDVVVSPDNRKRERERDVSPS